MFIFRDLLEVSFGPIVRERVTKALVNPTYLLRFTYLILGLLELLYLGIIIETSI